MKIYSKYILLYFATWYAWLVRTFLLIAIKISKAAVLFLLRSIEAMTEWPDFSINVTNGKRSSESKTQI